jgi:hypothetical protein
MECVRRREMSVKYDFGKSRWIVWATSRRRSSAGRETRFKLSEDIFRSDIIV